jgi:hypothetical protein
MNLSLAWSPLLPLPILIALAILAGAVAIAVLLARGPGAVLRAAALTLIVAALFNPTLRQEDQEQLDSVVAVVLDRSPSQSLTERRAQMAAAREVLEQRLGALGGNEIRWIDAVSSDSIDGTALFEALENGLADVPSDRVAAAILVTDGQVHDVPETAAALGLSAPIHVLLTGTPDERDRLMEVDAPPRFAIVGEEKLIRFTVKDLQASSAASRTGAPVRVQFRRNGEVIDERSVIPGDTASALIEIDRGGRNIIELEVEEWAGEISTANNTAVFETEGIRENLRVLLVSGEPHAGERTWRNILKSDAAVDLVHFTILRPPEKQDGTPITQLSLIAFPTRELFQEKIDEFDLIIFDRYRRRGVLPTLYFDNIARYVRDGGALLVSAGPDYAQAGSLHQTALTSVLPAAPTGRVIEGPFHPLLTNDGDRHPITSGLLGADASPPRWSRWFRFVESDIDRGNVLMSGTSPEDALLVVSREGEGRVALMLSDQTWLWARGYEGGGPYVGLLRRMVHWLMKEQSLEEEAIETRADPRGVTITRRTMGDDPGPLSVTTPDGITRELTMQPTGSGTFETRIDLDSPSDAGLYRLGQGALTALASVGRLDPREFNTLIRTSDILSPIVEETAGGIFSLGPADNIAVPRILPIRSGRSYSGADWLGIQPTQATLLRGVSAYPLFGGLLGLALLLGIVALTWYREGR